MIGNAEVQEPGSLKTPQGQKEVGLSTVSHRKGRQCMSQTMGPPPLLQAPTSSAETLLEPGNVRAVRKLAPELETGTVGSP